MKAPTLQEVIRQHIPLGSRPNGRGFFPILCKVCNDHGKKGKRAGFRFDSEVVGYNCFNCGHGALFDPHEHQTIPKSMVEVLRAFNIAETDWSPVLLRSLLGEAQKQGTVEQYKSIEPEEIEFPRFFYPLQDDPTDEWAQYAIEYLKQERGVDWQSHSFYLSKKAEHPDAKRWYGRLIIPTYKDNKLVFWQGRDLTDTMVKKYLSPNTPKECVLSGYEHIRAYTEEPLYIVEGWFDAHHLKGVAVFGNKMTPEQIKWINQSHRPKVVIPDRFGDGHLLAQQALDHGWSVSMPDIGSCKDVNDSIMKYGQLYTLMTIKENICSGVEASVRLEVYCEGKSRKSAQTNKATHK